MIDKKPRLRQSTWIERGNPEFSYEQAYLLMHSFAIVCSCMLLVPS
jgi:hypothetical protein